MFIVYGTYNFASKAIAFRNDYCLACEAPRLAVRIRTFNVVHLFWVPLLPLGYVKRWLCSTCSRKPHQVVKTRRPFKIAAAVIAALMALPAWMIPASEQDLVFVWLYRVLSGLVLIGAIVWVVKHQPQVPLKERLAGVRPYEEPDCPLCGARLLDVPVWHCPQCGAIRA